MKRVHAFSVIPALIMGCCLFILQSGFAQDQQKIVIIKKHIDENGTQTVERMIRQGNHEDKAIVIRSESDKIQPADDAERTITVNVESNDQSRKIEINVNGEVEVYELKAGEELSPEIMLHLAEEGVDIGLDPDNEDMLMKADKIVWVQRDDDADHEEMDFRVGSFAKGLVLAGKELAHLSDHMRAPQAWAIRDNINCAALGVYVSTNADGGVSVSNTIGESGAEESGIESGDVITMIDEYPTNTYPELHEVLSLYEPGDVVTVTLKRRDQEQRLDVQLRAWKDFPSFSHRIHASVRCGEEQASEVVSRKIVVIKKNRDEVPEEDIPAALSAPINTQLFLQDFTAFPNPSNGRFIVQFSGEELPTVVSIYDATGREVFRDAVEDFNGFYQKQVDLSGGVAGAFVLSVEQNGRFYTEQIILN